MAADERKPPRGKVKARTSVPRPRPTDAPAPTRRRRRLGRLGVVVVPVLAVALAIGLGVVLGIRSSRSADEAVVPTVPATQVTETQPTPTPTTVEAPKNVFGHTCGSCHTLAAAGATAGIGPNLDQIRPSRERTLNAIRNGSLSGAMPAGLLTGDDAERVADYVSRVAGGSRR